MALMMKPNDIDCLLCQAKVARGSYELDDCLDLIDQMAHALSITREAPMFQINTGLAWVSEPEVRQIVLDMGETIRRCREEAIWQLVVNGTAVKEDTINERPSSSGRL